MTGGRNGPRKPAPKRRPSGRRPNLAGIKQGVGRAVTKPIGAAKRNGHSVRCLDAFDPSHLPLPRAIAGYTVIRTTAIHAPTTVNRRVFTMFCPLMTNISGQDQWMNCYALSSNVGSVSQLDVVNGWTTWNMPGVSIAGGYRGARLTPSAITIQLMNPEAVQTTAGIVYIGRANNAMNVRTMDLTQTFDTLAQNLVAFTAPRLCSAAKLAFNGVKVSAVPNDMTEMADFTAIDFETAPQNLTLAAASNIRPGGFNPIFVYNPNVIDLQFLVCVEWRVRFGPANSMHSLVTEYPAAPDATWTRILKEMHNEPNAGVRDLVDRVGSFS